MKNPDLCERPYCRERWTVNVHGWKRGRSWDLHVCGFHAADYFPGTDSAGCRVSVSERTYR